MDEETRDLQCPFCGYVIVNSTSIGAVHCGPHVNWRGEHFPAAQMRTIRDWEEFREGAER